MTKKVVAVFDIGKTNKKLFLLDEDYHVIFEKSARLEESKDEDGYPCENIQALINFVHESMEEAMRYRYYKVVALNFSAYGASFVYLDSKGKVICPLYNYLKPFPELLQRRFYEDYDGELNFSRTTSSPVLGNLNSGMQLYRLKHEKPEIFRQIKTALHLPQFLSYLFTKQSISEITSIGCHTNLWKFETNDYHPWVAREEITDKLPPLRTANTFVETKYNNETLIVGTGLHDSSAALIPYLMRFKAPFILISTGTWCIALNPFNNTPLTEDELKQDVLCYLTYTATPVKASRLLVGPFHEEQSKRLATFFKLPVGSFYTMGFNAELMPLIEKRKSERNGDFTSINLSDLKTPEEAYHQLMYDIALLQARALRIVLSGSEVHTIFVDGGFSTNSLYMNMIARMFPDIKIYAASMPQGSALGAALVMHDAWNEKEIPDNLISLEAYSGDLQFRPSYP
jgi:sugar (pentulose or hexulose) kinase